MGVTATCPSLTLASCTFLVSPEQVRRRLQMLRQSPPGGSLPGLFGDNDDWTSSSAASAAPPQCPAAPGARPQPQSLLRAPHAPSGQGRSPSQSHMLFCLLRSFFRTRGFQGALGAPSGTEEEKGGGTQGGAGREPSRADRMAPSPEAKEESGLGPGVHFPGVPTQVGVRSLVAAAPKVLVPWRMRPSSSDLALPRLSWAQHTVPDLTPG